jgi:hypothetical protein
VFHVSMRRAVCGYYFLTSSLSCGHAVKFVLLKGLRRRNTLLSSVGLDAAT